MRAVGIISLSFLIAVNNEIGMGYSFPTGSQDGLPQPGAPVVAYPTSQYRESLQQMQQQPPSQQKQQSQPQQQQQSQPQQHQQQQQYQKQPEQYQKQQQQYQQQSQQYQQQLQQYQQQPQQPKQTSNSKQQTTGAAPPSKSQQQSPVSQQGLSYGPMPITKVSTNEAAMNAIAEDIKICIIEVKDAITVYENGVGKFTGRVSSDFIGHLQALTRFLTHARNVHNKIVELYDYLGPTNIGFALVSKVPEFVELLSI